MPVCCYNNGSPISALRQRIRHSSQTFAHGISVTSLYSTVNPVVLENDRGCLARFARFVQHRAEWMTYRVTHGTGVLCNFNKSGNLTSLHIYALVRSTLFDIYHSITKSAAHALLFLFKAAYHSVGSIRSSRRKVSCSTSPSQTPTSTRFCRNSLLAYWQKLTWCTYETVRLLSHLCADTNCNNAPFSAMIVLTS